MITAVCVFDLLTNLCPEQLISYQIKSIIIALLSSYFSGSGTGGQRLPYPSGSR